MGSGQLQLGIGDRMEALQALVVAKAWLTIPLFLEVQHFPRASQLLQAPFHLHQSSFCSDEDVSFHAEVWHVCEAPVSDLMV